MPKETLVATLEQFLPRYEAHYQGLMLQKLGFAQLPEPLGTALVAATVALLAAVEVGYSRFFVELAQQFSPQWRGEAEQILAAAVQGSDPAALPPLHHWRQVYHRCLQAIPETELPGVRDRIRATNPVTVLLRPEIEAVWEPITVENDWQPFADLLKRVQEPFLP